MIAIIQSKEELSLITKRYKKIPIIFPLNLEMATYCKINNIEFKFPFENNEYNNLSKEILLESKNFLEMINFKIIKHKFLINDIKAILRYKFNQTVFLIEAINNIKDKYEKIIYTDYFSNSKFWSENNFINIEDALKVLNLKNLEKLKCEKNSQNAKSQNLFKYELVGIKYKKEKKVILNNAGYNFKRIIAYFFLKNIKIAIPSKNLNFIKRFVFKLIGFELYDFSKTNIKVSNHLPDLRINFSYKNYDLSEILNNEFNSSKFYLGDLVEKYNALVQYLSLSNVKLTICNANREMGAILLEASRNKGIKSVLISHGTITKSYDQFDKVYKEYIAEGVFLGKADIKTIQHKIANQQ